MTTNHETVSLKDHFTALLAEKDKALSAALASAKEATQIAERNAEKWRDNANEWRGAMSDREERFVEKSTFNPFKEIIEKELDEIKKILQTMQGHSKGVSDGWGWLVGALGLLVGVVTVILRVVGK